MTNITGNPPWANTPATTSPIDEDALNNIETVLNTLNSVLGGKAPVDSPVFTGPVVADAVDPATTGNQLVTAAWVLTKLAALATTVGTRVTATYTTASLPAAARESGLFISNAQTIAVLHMQVSAYARVRLYDSTAHRDADAARALGVTPDTLTNVGCLTDMQLHAEDADWTMTPAPIVGSFSGNKIPITVDNLGSVATPITVTITYVILQP